MGIYLFYKEKMEELFNTLMIYLINIKKNNLLNQYQPKD